MPSTTPSLNNIISDLQNQNANLPTEKKQNIIVVQDNKANQDDKSGQMLIVMNNILNVVSEQLRMTKDFYRDQAQLTKEAFDFQKEAMDVNAGKWTPPDYSAESGGEGGGGGTAAPTGGDGVAGAAAKVGGGLWEGAKRIGGAIVDTAKKYPVATAVAGGAAIGTTIGALTSSSADKGLSKKQLEMRQHLIAGLDRAGISDPKERAAFLGQAEFETDHFRTLQEYGKGSKSNVKGGNQYYGRGFLQITNRDNYAMVGKSIGKDLLSNPNLLLNPDIAADASIAYWKKRVSPNVKDFGDVYQTTRGINANEPKLFKERYANRVATVNKYLKNAGEFSPEKTKLAQTATKEDKNSTTVQGMPLTHGEGLKNGVGDPNWAAGMRPLAAEKIQQVLDIMESKGYKSTVLEGRRADDRQADLYAQGRTKPGKQVTQVQHSLHQEGIAADIARLDKNGKVIPTPDKITTKEQKAYYKALGEAAHSVGLRYGGTDFGSFVDAPHVELRKGDKKIAGELPDLNRLQKGQQLATSDKTLPKTGRHELVQTGDTDQKSSAVFAGMLSEQLGVPFEKMIAALEKITKNTGDTKEEIKKASKTDEKGEKETATKTDETGEKETATKVEPEQPEKGYTATDFMGDEDKAKYEEAKKKALDESLKTGKQEINDDDIANQMNDEDREKFNTARQKAREAGGVQTATKEGGEEEPDLASMIGGNDEGSKLMRTLFGGNEVFGSAEPIEAGSPKRKYIDSLASIKDDLGSYVKDLLTGAGEGDESVLENVGGLGIPDILSNSGVTPTQPPGTFSEKMLQDLGVTPTTNIGGAAKEFFNPTKSPDIGGMAKEFFNSGSSNSQQEASLTNQKVGQLSNLGVTPFGGGQGMLGGFGGMMGGMGNNPFYSMQNVLGQIGSAANMGQNIGGMMQQGGLYGVGGAMRQIGGMLGSFGGNSPMLGGLGNVLGGVGGIMGNIGSMQGAFGQGNTGGVMGGIGAASSVLGSLGNIFGGMQGMGKSIGGMMGNTGGMGGMLGSIGVTPFGGGMGSMMGGLGGMGSMMGGLGGMMGGLGGMGGMMGGLGGMGGMMGGLGGLAGMIGGGGQMNGSSMGSAIGSAVGSIGGGIFGGGMGGSIGGMAGSLGGSLIGGLADGGIEGIGNSIGNMFGGIGDSLGGLFGGGDSGSTSTASLGIGDDAASLKGQTGGDLESLQGANDSMTSAPSGGGGESDSGGGMPGRNASGAPADRGSSGSSMGAGGGAGFKSGDKRAGSSAGAMGNAINPYNNCNVLFQWLYRNMWWAKV